jgi:hypothetical protein
MMQQHTWGGCLFPLFAVNHMFHLQCWGVFICNVLFYLLSFLFARHPLMIEMNKSTTTYKLRPMFTVYLTAYDDNLVCSMNWWTWTCEGLELLVICSVLPMKMFFAYSIIHVCHQTVGHIHSQAICHDWDGCVPWFHAYHDILSVTTFYP